jgi:hypothetical protein
MKIHTSSKKIKLILGTENGCPNIGGNGYFVAATPIPTPAACFS